VEAEFSYLRVFDASVPPNALTLFIPDRLACREIARQTVISGISKKLKGYSKKVWPPFPIHLQSTQGNIDAGWIFNEELKPIRMEELPPNEFSFDKRRKVVVKREFYQEEGSTAKKFKVLTDGKDKKKEEFATEIAGTLGAYATANQFSVGVLKNQLKRKNRLIKTLKPKLATAEEAAKDNTGIEQARMAAKKEIELLKAKLEQVELVSQTSQIQVGQQRDLIEQLQVRLEFTKSQVINIGIFQSQAMEIRSRVSAAQQSLLAKVETIRDNCLLIDQVSENLSVREREAGAARVEFQEAVIATANRESGKSSKFSISEQTRGNILLKAWEHSISEGKLQAKKVRKSCEEAFGSIDGNLLGIDSESNPETLSQMDMAKLSLDINEKEERDSVEVSQITLADIVQIDKCLIKPSVQLCAIDTLD
jgi:hypothetical protein